MGENDQAPSCESGWKEWQSPRSKSRGRLEKREDVNTELRDMVEGCALCGARQRGRNLGRSCRGPRG